MGDSSWEGTSDLTSSTSESEKERRAAANPPVDYAEYQRRLAKAEAEWAMKGTPIPAELEYKAVVVPTKKVKKLKKHKKSSAPALPSAATTSTAVQPAIPGGTKVAPPPKKVPVAPPPQPAPTSPQRASVRKAADAAVVLPSPPRETLEPPAAPESPNAPSDTVAAGAAEGEAGAASPPSPVDDNIMARPAHHNDLMKLFALFEKDDAKASKPDVDPALAPDAAPLTERELESAAVVPNAAIDMDTKPWRARFQDPESLAAYERQLDAETDLFEPDDVLQQLHSNAQYMEDGMKIDKRFNAAVDCLERAIGKAEFHKRTRKFIQQHGHAFSRHGKEDGEHGHEEYELFKRYSEATEQYLMKKLKAAVPGFDEEEFFEQIYDRMECISNEVWEIIFSIQRFESFCDLMVNGMLGDEVEPAHTSKLAGIRRLPTDV